MVWSAAYVNAAVLQDTYSAGVIQPNSRIYFLQDANWNTTAVIGLVSGNWQVVQRYTYSPYGTITVLNADWSAPPAGTQPLVNSLYQGMTLDSVTGLYYERNRNYSPSLSTWISQDPLQYIDGANTYQFVMSNPVNSVDPWGLTASAQSGGWVPMTDISGDTYWANTNTGAISWSGPQGPTAPVGTPTTGPSTGGWAPLTDVGGNTYWTNSGTGQISSYPGSSPAIDSWNSGLGEQIALGAAEGGAGGLLGGVVGTLYGAAISAAFAGVNYILGHPLPGSPPPPPPPPPPQQCQGTAGPNV